MIHSRHALLLLATLFSFITLYLPQPLQPALSGIYGRSAAEGGLFTTMAMLPLAIAPLLYGYLLGNRQPASLLKYALFALGLSNIVFAWISGFYPLLGVRFFQGALLPIIITAIITLLLQHSDNPQRTLSQYITFTILGGFSGRFFSALFDSLFNWQIFAWLTGIVLIFCAWRLPAANRSVSVSAQRPKLHDLLDLLKYRPVVTYLIVIYATFGSFVALLNYLPFLLRQAFPEAGSFVTGLMYSGYLIGGVTSLLAGAITHRAGVRRSLLTANLIFLLSLGLLFPASLNLTFFVLFAFCAAFFLTHTIALAQVNLHSPFAKPLTNAFYTAFYYSGAVVGSWLPGLIFQYYGKTAFLLTLISVSGVATFAILSLPAQMERKST